MKPRHADLTGQTFALKEDRREPLTCHLIMHLDQTAQIQQWKPYTLVLLNMFEELRQNFILRPTSFKAEDSNVPLSTLNERIWELQNLSEQAFLKYCFTDWSAPLLRMRIEGNKLYFAVPHLLMDGRALVDLALNLISLKTEGQPWKWPDTPLVPKKLSYLRSALRILKATQETRRNPHFQSSSRLRRFGEDSGFFSQDFDLPSLTGAIEKRRTTLGIGFTINDLLLTAHARSLQALARRQRQVDRVLIQTPVDMRRYSPPPRRLCNWSSFSTCKFATEITPEIRETYEKTKLQRDHQEEWDMIAVLDFANVFGVFKRSRLSRSRTGLARRALNEDGGVTNLLPTATLSNLGGIPKAPKSIVSINAIVPTFAPTNFSIVAVGINGRLNLSMRWTNANATKAEARFVFDRLLNEIAALLKCDQSLLLVQPEPASLKHLERSFQKDSPGPT